MKFQAKNKETGAVYFVADINFYASGNVNPTVQFLLWDIRNKCWFVDDAGNYEYAGEIPVRVRK